MNSARFLPNSAKGADEMVEGISDFTVAVVTVLVVFGLAFGLAFLGFAFGYLAGCEAQKNKGSEGEDEK